MYSSKLQKWLHIVLYHQSFFLSGTCSCSTTTVGIRSVQLCSGAAISPCSCDGNVCEVCRERLKFRTGIVVLCFSIYVSPCSLSDSLALCMLYLCMCFLMYSVSISICGWWIKLHSGLRQRWLSRSTTGLSNLYWKPISHLLHCRKSDCSDYFSLCDMLPLFILLILFICWLVTYWPDAFTAFSLLRIYAQRYVTLNKTLWPANQLQKKARHVHTTAV